jgi:flagellar biosynthetic protein FlhB
VIRWDERKHKSGVLIPLNLSFFAEGGDKTEKATPKKKEKAREEGQVAISQEISTALLFIAVFIGLRTFSGYLKDNMLQIFSYGFAVIPEADDFFTIDNISSYVTFLFLKSLLIVMPVFLIAMFVGVVTHVLQVGWHPTMKPLAPKFSKMNPASGFKRIFSFRALVELLKSLLKFGIIGYVILTTLQKESHMIFAVIDMGLFEAAGYIANVAMEMGISVGSWYVAIAAADFIYVRLKHNKELMMSKQEIKDEYKSIEGNPQIKGQIRQRMREASMRRMMQDVPKADVIITNPTHFAIALKYERDSGLAPKVIAKGADHMARRIKEKAIECNVTIVENKPLARTLYATVDIGREIPPELYQSVAEILAYVYKLKNIA